MSDVVVVVPVLGRPQNAVPLAASLAASTPGEPHRLVFVCSPGDEAQIDACATSTDADILIAEWESGPGDYARKVNLAVRETDEPWVFLGADDLRFRAQWAEAAIETARRRFLVVGTNDLGNSAVRAGKHSTHSLVARSYIDAFGTIDEPGVCLHEGYDHQYVDNEFVETAISRDLFVAARRSVVEHLHPHWSKAPMDATYEKALAATAADRALFTSRRRLWVTAIRRSRSVR